MFTITRSSKVLAVLLVVLCILTGCATTSQQVPSWVFDNNSAWDPALYITAVGQGMTIQQAQEDATQALARVLQQKVQATTVASQNLSKSRSAELDETTIQQNLNQLVTVGTDLSITGMRIQEKFCQTDRNGNTTWYALALLDREVAGAWYEEQVLQNSEQIFSLQAASGNAELNHQGFTAIQHLRKAEALAHLTDEQVAILSVVHPVRYETVLPVWQTAEFIETQRQQLEKSLVFGVSIANDYDQRIAKAIQTVFAQQNLDCTLITADSTAGVITGELTITPFDSSNPDNANKYVRYTLTASLKDVQGTEQLPLTITGREAHLSTEEATQRAIRTVENELKKKLAAELQKALQ